MSINSSFSKYKNRLLEELHRSFQEEHTPHETAASFSFGMFICSLPTLGTGLILFGVLSKFIKRINKIALFSTVLVLNPLIKPLFYVTSINLGAIILTGGLEFTINPEKLLIYLIIGNTIIAFLTGLISYIIVYRMMKRYQKPVDEIVKDLDKMIEEKRE